MTEPFDIKKLHITQEQYSYLHSLFYDKAGVKDLETYFEEYNTISREDNGAVLSDALLREIELHFDYLMRCSKQDLEVNSDMVLVSFAVDPTRKHRLQEKFNAMSVIDEKSIQECQVSIFEQAIRKDILQSLKVV